MDAKSKSRKRKDLSGLATPSQRMRLNGESKGPFVGSPVSSVKDLRVHRIFSSVSVPSSDETDDCDAAKKVFGSGISFEKSVGSFGQIGESEGIEVVQDSVQATPPDEVVGEGKMVDSFEKSEVYHATDSSPQVAGRRRSPGCKTLKACSRTKLFGNPSSFSYRRLLPYLMDITKGALKSLDMKPQLLKNAGNSVVESPVSTLEPAVSCGTDSSSLRQRLSPSPTRKSEPNTCNENTADTVVPFNYSGRDQKVPDSVSTFNLSDKNDKLSQSGVGKVVRGGMAAFGNGKDAQDTVISEVMNDSNRVDSATQHSPDGDRGDLMDVLGGSLLCKSAGSVDVQSVEKNDVNMCGKNFTRAVEEKPVDKEASSSKGILGIANCVSKPYGSTPTKRNLDHEQLVISEANMPFSSETMSGSSPVDSATKHSPGDDPRDEQTNVLGDALSCKSLVLSDADEVKENAVNYLKSQSTNCSQKNAELFQRTPVRNEDLGRKDVLEKVKSISKLDNQLDDGTMTDAERSVCEQINGSADSKQSSSSERKLYLKPRQLKRFKNYNSVSYRKLLPYLTEIYGDSAGSSNKNQVKRVEVPVNVGNSIKNNRSTYSSVSNKTWPGDSRPTSDTTCDDEPELTNSESFSDLEAVTDSPTELHLENGMKSPIDLRSLSHVQGQPIQSPSSSCCPNDMHIGERVEKAQCTASNSNKEDMTINEQHSDDFHLSNIVSIYPEPITPHGKSSMSPIRRILKKNPTGCRGLCTCVKCASFRIHAEKAFEFSRSQLLESEEIALELINELSLLRNLLEKSTDADSEVTSQVQEACEKAYAIEQCSKAQFEQMNHDLRIHCQIPNLQRPSVTFARHLEERIIQTAHRPSKQYSP